MTMGVPKVSDTLLFGAHLWINGGISITRLLAIVIAVIFLTGCTSINKEERIKSMLSDEEGKYYVTILGAPKEMENDFTEKVFQPNVSVLTGFYINENPSEQEIKELDVKGQPTFIVFDTATEVHRTNSLKELNQFLTNKRKALETNNRAKTIAWNFLQEKGWAVRAKDNWKQAEVTKIIASKRFELLDKSFEGKEVLSVTFEAKENVVAGPPEVLLDLGAEIVIGYIPSE